MQSEAKYFNGQYYGQYYLLLSEVMKHFEIDGTVHFGENGRINVDGSLRYIGTDIKKLYNLRFGIIRGHACFDNIVIKDWFELPKIEYANLLTFRYCQELGLLRLLEHPLFDWNCPDGVVRVIPKSSTDEEHKKIDRNVYHELKSALAIIKEYQVLYQSAENKRKVTLDAQAELINSGCVEFAFW